MKLAFLTLEDAPNFGGSSCLRWKWLARFGIGVGKVKSMATAILFLDWLGATPEQPNRVGILFSKDTSCCESRAERGTLADMRVACNGFEEQLGRGDKYGSGDVFK